jgi:hypothetical protein
MTTKDKFDTVIKGVLGKRAGVFTLNGPKFDKDYGFKRPGGIGSHHMGSTWIAVDPIAAKELAALGYPDQKSIQNKLWETAQAPYESLTDEEKAGIETRIEYSQKGWGWMLGCDYLQPEQLKRWVDGYKPGGKIPWVWGPEAYQAIVVGDEDTERMPPNLPYLATWGFMKDVYSRQRQFNTAKITGATLTKNGR